MNEFFKLLRDFIIFIPLGILIFGIFFSLIGAIKENLILLFIGFIIFIYGLIASYLRQIYKDYLSFLKKELFNSSDCLKKWRKYHRLYYVVQFLLLGIFIYILWYFFSAFQTNKESIIENSPTFVSLFNFTPLDWEAVVAIGTAFSAIALIVTLCWLIRYTRATEKIAEYQVMPAIDVRMVYNKEAKKTYFWFSNKSNSPGWVHLSWVYLDKKKNTKTNDSYPGLRISPNEEGIKTADSFLENPSPDDEVKLNVLIKSAFRKLRDEELNTKIEFEKSYRFNGGRNSWDDTSWGYPVDRPFPFPQKIKRCPECKSEIDFEAKKCRYCLAVITGHEDKSNEN